MTLINSPKKVQKYCSVEQQDTLKSVLYDFRKRQLNWLIWEDAGYVVVWLFNRMSEFVFGIDEDGLLRQHV